MADLTLCSKCRQPEPSGEAVPIMGKDQRPTRHLCVACIVLTWDLRRTPWGRIPRRFHAAIRLGYARRMKLLLDSLRPLTGMSPRTFRKEA